MSTLFTFSPKVLLKIFSTFSYHRAELCTSQMHQKVNETNFFATDAINKLLLSLDCNFLFAGIIFTRTYFLKIVLISFWEYTLYVKISY